MLAVAGSKRSRGAPELPTVGEAGLKGYAVDTWFGVVAPAKTPQDIVAKLSAAVGSIMKMPDVRQRLEQLGYDPIGDTSAEFGATIKADSGKFARIIKQAGIKGGL